MYSNKFKKMGKFQLTQLLDIIEAAVKQETSSKHKFCLLKNMSNRSNNKIEKLKFFHALRHQRKQTSTQGGITQPFDSKL